MADTVKEREMELCPEQVEAVKGVIYARMTPDDRDPHEVVETDFGGDWNHYLKTMADWHRIDLFK